MARQKEKVLLCALFLNVMFFLNIGAPILGSQNTQTFSSHGAISYPVSGASGLHTSGTKIYDANNQEVKLWGVNFFSGYGGAFTVTQADLQSMKNMGFNMLRIWIKWRLAQPTEANSVNESYFSSTTNWQIDQIIQWGADIGLYIVLCTDWTPTWPLPSWVTPGNVPNADGGGGISLTDATNLQGIAYLYGWMANRYASYNHVIFEGLNELNHGGSEMANWRAWNNNWVSAVEANEGSINHLKIIQFLVNYNGDPVSQYLNLYPPFITGTHDNILLATHSYFIVRDSLAASRNEVAAAIDNACASAGRPWIDTEFSHFGGYSLTQLNAACAAMTQNDISGWGYYCYCKSGGADYSNSVNVYNPTYKTQILNILQPYMTQP